MKDYTTRISVERAIIKEILSGTAFVAVSDILSDKNFKDELHGKIYAAAMALFPAEINILSVHEHTGIEAHRLVDIGLFEFPATNLRHLAVWLLEDSMHDRLVEIAMGLPALYRPVDIAIHLRELDVFSGCDHLIAFLKNCRAEPSILSSVELFGDQVRKKIKGMRELSAVSALYKNLDALYKLNPSQSALLKILADTTRRVLSARELEQNFELKILALQ